MLRTQLKTISVSPLEEFRFGPANQEARSRGDNERRACPRGANQLQAGELTVTTGGYYSSHPSRLSGNMRACRLYEQCAYETHLQPCLDGVLPS
jgi:hypothetical protein